MSDNCVIIGKWIEETTEASALTANVSDEMVG
jgi:hypothetical protein